MEVKIVNKSAIKCFVGSVKSGCKILASDHEGVCLQILSHSHQLLSHSHQFLLHSHQLLSHSHQLPSHSHQFPVTQSSAAVTQSSAAVTQPSVPVTQSSAAVTHPLVPVTDQQSAAIMQPSVPVKQSSAAVMQQSVPVTESLTPITQLSTPQSLNGNSISPLYVPCQAQLPQVRPLYIIDPSSDTTLQITEALAKVTQLQSLPQAGVFTYTQGYRRPGFHPHPRSHNININKELCPVWGKTCTTYGHYRQHLQQDMTLQLPCVVLDMFKVCMSFDIAVDMEWFQRGLNEWVDYLGRITDIIDSELWKVGIRGLYRLYLVNFAKGLPEVVLASKAPLPLPWTSTDWPLLHSPGLFSLDSSVPIFVSASYPVSFQDPRDPAHHFRIGAATTAAQQGLQRHIKTPVETVLSMSSHLL
ncbi:hypothetical protein OS493_002572 [Desmophyllum pertusum]|uniref:Uncharacterized protein n=1 Tax=Desmophyllum pertusum TaxID=174260 RepID=A0A9W9YT76_9CNID|nr:hypothetical protein OS493_002572 [Desmophyllum pertusum]